MAQVRKIAPCLVFMLFKGCGRNVFGSTPLLSKKAKKNRDFGSSTLTKHIKFLAYIILGLSEVPV